MRQHWPIIGIALLCLLVVADPTPVTAHAVLLRSIPPSGQTLPRPPVGVQLLFSEPIDPLFSAVRVLDDNGRIVDSGDSHVDDANDHILAVSLPPGLPNGVYRVSWRSLSTIDVHPDAGEYPLFVGVPVSESSAATATTYQSSATPATTFGRWWFYVAASLFGGVLLTFKLVLSGVLVGEFAEKRAEVRRQAFRLIVLGGCLLVLGTLFTAVAQAAAAADVSLTDAIGRPLADLLLRGRFATIWWPRLGLEVASLLLIALGGLEGLAAECALATLPAVLLTSSLTSHGAALPAGTAPGILIDWLHVLGATAWVGGLITLLGLLPTLKSGLIPHLVPRFSRFALAASGLIVLSGVVQATLEIGAWMALLTTAYGQLVLVKLALIGSMFVVAGLNRWVAGALRMGIRAELALGVLALATAAVLSGTPPPRG
jgi:copper transport protein